MAEVASAFEDVELVVNIQGDEPLIDPGAIDAAMLPLLEEPAIPMGTLKKRIEDPREIADPNVVKVVTDRFENAIYFSRSTIPYTRDAGDCPHFKHIGLYVYRRNFLLRYSDLPVGPLEQAERLEQLQGARKRLQDPRGRDRLRIARRRYAGRSGARPGVDPRRPMRPFDKSGVGNA